MSKLHLNGTLELAGTLALEGKVLVDGEEALVALKLSPAQAHVEQGPLPSDEKNIWVWAGAGVGIGVTIGGKTIVVNGAPCTSGFVSQLSGQVAGGIGKVTVQGAAVAAVKGTAIAGIPIVWEKSGQ